MIQEFCVIFCKIMLLPGVLRVQGTFSGCGLVLLVDILEKVCAVAVV